MTTYRDLLNPLLLTDKYVGFIGDSEYVNKNGKLVMGMWKFLVIFDGWLKDTEYPSLDDEVDWEKLSNEDGYIELFNDNDELCGVEFMYRGDLNG